ncbi:hypothetical protein HOT31_gp042 [Microbacterium phage Hendrix]|uniref:Uncharacterized protein n=1 Tax=Microbacterium phage Hendrix TaxID=2182341 RepID=A0A2U8UUG4_9CAUD|nr:hypothetical protein HOT31_gp042 [Microbacterium phage Hendrix]AWN07713.1 hypothetical protein PBI_HENDRIX_42 [Microbacterium phage Hendrix]
MQLMAEMDGRRTYLGNDGETWYEVRVEAMSKTYPIEERHYVAFEEDPTRTVPNHPELQAVLTRCSLALREWFMDYDQFDPLGEQRVSYSSETYDREELAKFMFNPAEFLPGTPYRIVIIEQLFWPPAPVDPTPATNERKPRKNDFRGDRFA